MNDLKRPLVTVRPATGEDRILLAGLGARTFAETFSASNTSENMRTYLADAFSPERQAQELAEPASLFFIAEIGGESAGYTRLREGPAPAGICGSRPLEIVRLYVIQERIGQGVGAALMEACLSEARRRGNDTIWLDVWEENSRAINFYRRWGFEKAGWQLFKLGDDLQLDWLMQRPVAQESSPEAAGPGADDTGKETV